MDIMTVGGLLLGATLLLIGIGPANLPYFIDPGSMVIVIGGTIAAADQLSTQGGDWFDIGHESDRPVQVG